MFLRPFDLKLISNMLISNVFSLKKFFFSSILKFILFISNSFFAFLLSSFPFKFLSSDINLLLLLLLLYSFSFLFFILVKYSSSLFSFSFKYSPSHILLSLFIWYSIPFPFLIFVPFTISFKLKIDLLNIVNISLNLFSFPFLSPFKYSPSNFNSPFQ